jgi:hypothetical protein
MFSLGSVVGIALLLFWIWALLDCIATDAAQCRNLPKVFWIVLIVIIPDIGALVWVLLGRPERTDRHSGSSDYAAPRRPVGAEDSPQYETNPIITDRRSRELDLELERWEREQRERGESSRGESSRGESNRGDPEAPL